MKTVTEASNEQYKLYKKAHDLVAEDMAISFKKGVDFAQKWISTKTELPKKECSDFILFRCKHSVYCFKPNCLEMDLEEWIKINHITGWRPVSFL